MRGYDFECQVEIDQNILHSAILPIELTNGNDGRGSKWFSSAKARKAIEATLHAHRRTPFTGPVHLTLTRILGAGQRLWDHDSIGRGNAKELVDSLVALGWFHDDKPKWIFGVDYRQDDKRRNLGPAVEVVVKEQK